MYNVIKIKTLTLGIDRQSDTTKSRKLFLVVFFCKRACQESGLGNPLKKNYPNQESYATL